MAVKNLVSGTLADDITTSTTNILVHIADNIGAQSITDFFPNPPFYITIMPKTPTIGVANRLDSEIIKITNVGHDQVGNAALTGVRAQRDTTARAFSTGDIVTVGSYCDDAVFLSDDGMTETEQPWIKGEDIVWSSFTKTLITLFSITTIGNTNVTQSWVDVALGQAITVSGLDPNGTYAIIASTQYAESSGIGEFRLVATGESELSCNSYHSGALESVSYAIFPVKPNADGNIVFRRYYRGDTGNVRCGECRGLIIRIG